MPSARSAGCPALLKEQLAEPGEVAERRADAAVGHGIAAGVHGDLRVELGTHRLPQLCGYELVQPGPGRSFEDPGQHIGEDGAVAERPAMGRVVLERAEIAECVLHPCLAV